MLLLVDWDSVTILQNSKVACKSSMQSSIFSGLYDIAFPKQTIKIRDKTSKDHRNQKAFKGLCTKKKKKNYTKRFCKKKKKKNQYRKIHDIQNIQNTEEEI